MTTGRNRAVTTRTLERHRAFWSRGEASAPLVGASRWPYVSMRDFDWDLPGDEGELDPAMLRVEHLLEQYAARYAAGGVFDGDCLWPATPPRAVPWLEGILGCKVEYSLPAASIFARPIFEGWPASLPEAIPLAENPWFRKLESLITGIARVSGGRFPVALPLTRGPWDLAAAVRGTGDLYLDLYDQPAALTSLAESCARTWIDVTRALAAVIPTWGGGYVSHFGMWSPWFDPMPQDDVSVGVSARHYAALMRDADVRVTSAWQGGIFHLHSAGLQVLEEVLGFLGGRALNVAVDPGGPTLDALVPMFDAIQRRGVPLHLTVTRRDEVERLAAELDARGLAIWYLGADVGDASAGGVAPGRPAVDPPVGVPRDGRREVS